jgi:hypothetical protein
MTGFFMNIREVEHPNKQRFLRETIREEGVCFIGLSETIKINYTINWFKKIIGIYNFPGYMFHQKGDLGEESIGSRYLPT